VPAALIVVENDSVPADTRVWPECIALRNAGWEVVVISPKGANRDLESFSRLAGVEIHRFDQAPSSGGALGYAREYAVALRRITRLVQQVARDRSFDVVQACNPPDFLLLTARQLRKRGAATIFDHHDLSPELFVAKYGRRFPLPQALQAVERLGFALADVVLAANESFREVAITRGRKSPDDVFVVRNGPDPALFRPTQPDAETKRGATHVIGYVGMMGSQDGIDVALESLALLKQRRSDWRAIFVGDGDALPAARASAQRLELGEAVDFLGFVQDRERLTQLIASCDVCISPEPRNVLNEHSTLVKVAEYLAVGRPVVAFDLKETRRTARDAAAYAPADDAQSFSTTIDTLLDDPSRRQRMSEAGKERAESLRWEHSERALLAAYDRALERASIRRSSR
jgi:glycosyltransferase involved in cell wall biosynthesis